MIYSLTFPAALILLWLVCFVWGQRRDNRRTAGQVAVCALYEVARWVESVSKFVDAYVLTVARGVDHGVALYHANQRKSITTPACLTFSPMEDSPVTPDKVALPLVLIAGKEADRG